MAQTAWDGCSGASSMCVPRERRKVLGRRQLCQLSSSSGTAGSSVQKRCSGPAAGRGPSLHHRSFPERAGVPALCTGAVEPCSTATYATEPTSTSEFMH